MNKISSKEALNKLKKKLVADLKRRNEQDEISLRSGATLADLTPAVQVESVGFDNEERKIHHTEHYELMDRENPTPIFRRGETFSLDLQLSREYDAGLDIMHFVASYGPSPSVSKGTKFKIHASDGRETNKDHWRVHIAENNGRALRLKISCPVKSQVGRWRFQIHTSTKDSQSYEENSASKSIFYILFNPWCKDDEVFLEGEEARNEYLLRDNAHIFSGTYKHPTAQNWIYGQFDYAVLPAVELLMEHSDLRHSERGSAVQIARAISALANVNDDGGLLVGNWSGDYRDGTPPEAWTGSTAIFEEYLRSGGTPVNYAQCWVFAGCVTTACRALGIPCRTITCFDSAHDADKSLTIDSYIGENGMPLNVPMSRDSIWNFHCWNEAWMARRDLTEEYNGWQVIDGTPQERSRGMFRVGPAPVKAVHDGFVGLYFDVEFVFAEVNADICVFQTDHQSPWGYSLVNLNTKNVGRLIVTQSFNHDNRPNDNMERVTHQYKYPEGSEEERKTFYKALKLLPKAQKLYEEHVHPLRLLGGSNSKDVIFEIKKVNSVPFGKPFDVSVSIENESDELRSVEVSLDTSAVRYTGLIVSHIKAGNRKFTLQSKQSTIVKMSISPEDYNTKMTNTGNIKLTVVCNVKETKQVFTDHDTFEIIKTSLLIEVNSVAKVGTLVEATFSFKNPIPERLTNCKLIIEGTGVQRPKVLTLSDVQAEGTMSHSVQMRPRRSGPCVLVGVFLSKQLTNIKGTAAVTVQE